MLKGVQNRINNASKELLAEEQSGFNCGISIDETSAPAPALFHNFVDFKDTRIRISLYLPEDGVAFGIEDPLAEKHCQTDFTLYLNHLLAQTLKNKCLRKLASDTLRQTFRIA